MKETDQEKDTRSERLSDEVSEQELAMTVMQKSVQQRPVPGG